MQSEHHTTAAGVRLAYTVHGSPDAPPVVLLHGLGDRGTSWAPVHARFAERFRVITVDLRGHGDSDRPGTYSLQLMCDDVADLLDHLGSRRVTVIGHSMGGMVAYLLAVRRADQIDRLVVEDAPPPYPRDRPVPERPDEPLDFDWAVVPAIVGQVNAGDPPAWAQLARITAPTLLVGGGAASHVPQDTLTDVAARIPCCTVLTIDAGHEVHTARPTEFADAVLDWLGT